MPYDEKRRDPLFRKPLTISKKFNKGRAPVKETSSGRMKTLL